MIACNFNFYGAIKHKTIATNYNQESPTHHTMKNTHVPSISVFLSQAKNTKKNTLDVESSPINPSFSDVL